MDYPKSYFEDEVRDGFFVPSIMKKCWAYNKKLHKELECICRKNNLNCSVAWGSLLGAVRHGGYIPWDDDMDIEMSRIDYELFYEISQKDNKKEYIIIDDIAGKSNAPEFVRRYTKFRGIVVSPEYWNDQYGFPFFSGIDIFIDDFIPDEGREEYYRTAVQLAREIYNNTKDFRGKKDFGEKADLHSQLVEKMDLFCKQYSKEDGNERAIVPTWVVHDNRVFDNRLYDDFIELPFEQGTVRVPIGYDRIVREFYPNYMYPRTEWDNHNYPFFNNWEREMKEQQGINLLRYEFDSEQYRNTIAGKLESVTCGQQVLNSLSLLTEAHENISSILEDFSKGANSIDEIEGTLGLLAQCQELAIQMAEQIEEKVIDSSKIIHILEEYCEFVFEIYQVVNEVVKNEENSDYKPEYDVTSIEKYFFEFEKYMTQNLNAMQEKKEIVFLVYQSRYWKYLHSLWEEACSDKQYIVTVIPVPYYYRDFEGELEKDMQLEMEGYPSEVTLTSYENYNFEVHHPDVVVYQFPYDEYNYALSWHPFFYSSNLRKYTEKLVFIPPYVLREIEDQDERAKYTLRWLIQTPGLVYADSIFVQSEQMKKGYEELLTEFIQKSCEKEREETAKEKLTINWSERIKDTGSPYWDWEQRERERIEGAKRKKVLLYYVSMSVLYQYQWKCLSKISEFFEVAQRYQDEVDIIWYQDPNMQAVMEKRCSDIWKAYCQLINDFKDRNLGEIKEDGDYEQMARYCDAIYGDGGVLMTKCREEHKLVLFETPELSVEQENDYVYKKWTDDVQVAVEGEWSLQNILQEMMEYKYEVPARDCGRRIWETITERIGEKSNDISKILF